MALRYKRKRWLDVRTYVGCSGVKRTCCERDQSVAREPWRTLARIQTRSAAVLCYPLSGAREILGSGNAASSSRCSEAQAAAWSANARAQQRFERMGRIGVLVNLFADDPESVAASLSFRRACGIYGWIVGRNIQMDVAGPPAISATIVNLRQNWSRSRRTPFWPPPRLPFDPCWN